MHFATLLTLGAAVVSASASLTARQQPPIPDCAHSCSRDADLGGCSQTDTKCLCTNTNFVNTTTQCINKACTGADLQAAIAYTQQLCASVGVTLTASSTATSAASASSSTSPATASSAATPHGANALVSFAVAGLVALTL